MSSLVLESLAEQLTSILKESDFNWNPAFSQFRKKTNTGFQCVILSVSDYEDLSIYEPHFGIRFDKVEELAFPYTNGLRGFQKDSMTLVVSAAKLLQAPFFRLEIADQEDVLQASKKTMELFEQKGLPFFKNHQSLSQMDKLFNASPDHPVPFVNNAIHRCIRGMVIARLNGRNDLPALADQYRHTLQNQFAPEVTKRKFEELVTFLTHYAEN